MTDQEFVTRVSGEIVRWDGDTGSAVGTANRIWGIYMKYVDDQSTKSSDVTDSTSGAPLQQRVDD